MRQLVAILVLASGLQVAAPAHAAESLTVIVQTTHGAQVTSAAVSVDGVSVTADADGRFIVDVPGEITVTAPGYLDATHAWDGTTARLLITLAPTPVFSVHVTGWHAGSASQWNSLLNLAATTSINSFMIDLKDESGRVFSKTPSGRGDELGSTLEYYDLEERTQQAHDAGLYVITRIVTFQDPFIGKRQPSWAAWNTATGGPLTRSGQVFLDPWDVNARQYGLDLAVDACSMGVDEVQFDYIRFPDGNKTSVLFDGPSDPAGRSEAIRSFLEEASDLLHPMGCAVAADIFGFIISIDGEGGIGQQLETLAEVTDVLSPMVYPSHYSSGWFGFSDPNAHPYQVVFQALGDGLPRLADGDAILRPWIQDFWYTPSQVAAEISASDDQGVGWMLWNASGEFSTSGIPRAGTLDTEGAQSVATLVALPGSGFYDVADSNIFASDIAWLADSGITRGCTSAGDDFCPTDPVTRGQMAAFLVRAFGYSDVDPLVAFTDDDNSIFESDIARLATAGVTRGCNPPDNTHFCPDRTVTRAEMAAFLVRALALPSTDTDFFDDDNGSLFEADINRLAAAGITSGTGPQAFSPDAPVRREQMAAFLRRSLGG